MTEYRALLADAPDDPCRAYLLGRVTLDVDEAEALFQRAANAPKPCIHSLSALAFNQLNIGQFDDALTLSQRALRAQPNHPTFHWTHRMILEALDRFDEALADFRKDKLATEDLEEEIYLLARAGKEREVKQKLHELVEGHAAAGRADDGREQRRSLEAMLAYVEGDKQRMLDLAEGVSSPQTRFARAATAGDLETAVAALADLKGSKAFSALLLSLVVRRAERVALADELLAVALAAPGEAADARRALRWAAGEVVPSVDQALRIGLPPGEKAVLLTALGYRFPERRDSYFALARKLNFDKRFPHMLIQELMD